MTRRILIASHPFRPEAVQAAEVARQALVDQGVEVLTRMDGEPIEAVIVLGGDGTLLRAARDTRGSGAPLLGVNLGHVGFLAELEREDIHHAAACLARGEYWTEQRRTVEVTIHHPDSSIQHGWALNEVTVERMEMLGTLDVAVGVDGRPLSSFGCDGVVVATPTGSTAHAFSGGGPVVWPEVEAILVVPLAAHALFARPLVLGPHSHVTVQVLEQSPAEAVLVLDGAEMVDVRRGARIEVRMSDEVVHLARTSDAPFTERLVRKFGLPTVGWRGPSHVDGS